MNKEKGMALPITVFTLALLTVTVFLISKMAVFQAVKIEDLKSRIEVFEVGVVDDIFTDDTDGLQTLNDLINPLELPEFPESFGGDVLYSSDETISDSEYNSINLTRNNIELDFPENSSGENGETKYVINSLVIEKNNAVLNLYPGEYWIGNLTVQNNLSVEVSVSGEGTVKIFVDELSIGNNSTFNYPGDPGELLIITYNDFYLKNAKISGGIYSIGNVELENSEVVGAVVGETFSPSVAEVVSQIYYDDSVLDTLKDLDF